jgi:hypothetical protein
MNSRERVLAVLNRETPDRVPVDIWLAPELVEAFKQKLGVDDELLRGQGVLPHRRRVRAVDPTPH